MRAVVDTNVLISGLIRPLGAPGRVVRALRDRHFVALVSTPILEEIVGVLSRPWLREKYGVETTAVETFLSFLVLRAELVDVRSEIRLCRDPQDDKFLEAAVDGGADRLVSGDSDLLALGSIEGVAIVDSTSFLDAIE